MKMCICSCQPGSTHSGGLMLFSPCYKYTVAGKIVGGSVCIWRCGCFFISLL
jgi:hypothetical protein